MLRIKNEYLVVVAMGLLCTFMGSVIVSLIAVNFVVALVCAIFCMKKGYIFVLLLALNFALYFNAIDAPFEQLELWTLSRASACKCDIWAYCFSLCFRFSCFFAASCLSLFLYSLCVVLCALCKSLRAKFEL